MRIDIDIQQLAEMLVGDGESKRLIELLDAVGTVILRKYDPHLSSGNSHITVFIQRMGADARPSSLVALLLQRLSQRFPYRD